MLAVAAVLALAITPFIASPASAKTAATGTGCNKNVTPGAEIGMYPSFDIAESSLVAACVFEYDSTAQEVSGNFHIEDFGNVLWHNGASRSIPAGSYTKATVGGVGQITITADPASGTCAELAAYGGHTISTTSQALANGFKADTFIKSIAGCVITLDQPFQGAGPVLTLLLDNGYAHVVPSGATPSPIGGSTTAGSCVITDTANQSLASDVGKTISGTNIPRYATISAVTAGTSWTFTAPGGACALATATDQDLSIGGSIQNATAMTVRDSTATYVGTVLSSTVPRFAIADNGFVGLKITFTNGNASCVTTYITSITTANKANVANSETGCAASGAAPLLFTIGETSITAPRTGDVVLNQQVSLDLSPSLVTGSDDCTYEHVEGFGIQGTWTNPQDGFDPASTFLVLQPDKTKAIAELKFTTSVITYAGYVLEYTTGAYTPAQLNTTAHYSLDFPGTPTTSALCGPANGYTLTANSPGLGFAVHVPAVAASQSAIQSGVGKPGSSQLRSIQASATSDGAFSVSGSVVDDSGGAGLTAPWNSGTLAPFFTRSCIRPSGGTPLPLVDFKCGQ